MIKQRIENLIAFGNQLPHAKVYFRDDWACYYFDLFGKQFALLSDKADTDAIITVKGQTEDNERLRAMYEDVVPGYYANKRLWNSVLLKTTALSDHDIEALIQASYDLVWQKLPAKIRKEYGVNAVIEAIQVKGE